MLPGSSLRCPEGPGKAPAVCAALRELRASHAGHAQGMQHGLHLLQGLLLSNHGGEPCHFVLLHRHTSLASGSLSVSSERLMASFSQALE